MTQKRCRRGALAAAAAILFTGCAGTGPSGGDQPGPKEDGAAAGQEAEPGKKAQDKKESQSGDGKAESQALEDADSTKSGALAKGEKAGADAKPAATEPKKHRVFFAFDSAELSEAGRKRIRDHADYIQAKEGLQVTLEGHTDERGSREYNLALGERRAKSVRRVLLVHGVDQKRIEIVSFGEEQPLVKGNTEQAYAKNRRVRIRYER